MDFHPVREFSGVRQGSFVSGLAPHSSSRLFSLPGGADATELNSGSGKAIASGRDESGSSQTHFVKGLAYGPESGPLAAPEKIPDPAPPGPPTGLKSPDHYTAVPITAPGVQIVLSRYLSFRDVEGRQVFARMFLLETNLKRVYYSGVSPEIVARRRALPQRLKAYANEIEVTDPKQFAADFDIPPEYVTFKSPGIYEVDLGSVQCTVRTVISKE